MVKKQKRNNKLKIIFCVVAALVVAGLVFAGLFFFGGKKEEEKIDYSVVQAKIQELTGGRKETEKFLDLKIKSAKLSDEEKKTVEEFEKVVPEDSKMQEVLQEIKDTNAGRNAEVEKAVNEVALSYTHLRALYLLEKDMSVMYDGELSDKDLEALSKSDYDYLANMAKDVNDYRAKVKKLSAKDKDFEKNYKSLVEEGEKLEKKYAEVKFEDMTGTKKEEILAYYDKIDELNKLLLEQEQR